MRTKTLDVLIGTKRDEVQKMLEEATSDYHKRHINLHEVRGVLLDLVNEHKLSIASTDLQNVLKPAYCKQDLTEGVIWYDIAKLLTFCVNRMNELERFARPVAASPEFGLGATRPNINF